MDLISNGLQATEMLKTAGFSPENAFNFGVDAYIEAQRLANSTDPYYKNAIYSVGGVGGAYQSLIKNLLAFDRTGIGDLNTSVNYGTNSTDSGSSNSPQENTDIAAQIFTDPNQYYKYDYNKARVMQSVDFTQKSQNLLGTTMEIMKSFGLNYKDPEIVSSFMSKYLATEGINMSPQEASLIIGAATNVGNPIDMLDRIVTGKQIGRAHV